jgi:hypothetical protein
MVTLVATGKVDNGGPVVITATTLTGGADHPTPAKVSGREQYLRCLEAEGCPAEWADDPQFWMRPAVEDDYEDIRRGN